MNSVVVYDTKFGNTARLAEAIGSGLAESGPVRLLRVDDPAAAALGDADLLVLGGPTQWHGMSRALRRYVDHLRSGPPPAPLLAVFDTRYRGAAWRTGSAGLRAARSLERSWPDPLVPCESFFVRTDAAELLPGEVERAARWATDLGVRAAARLRQVA
jgi:flavodoxin